MQKWLFALLGLVLNSSVMAATVFAPTDGDVNFLFTTSYTGSGLLAMFDDQDQTYNGSNLVLGAFDLVSFTPIGTDVQASNQLGNLLTLTGSTNFILGFSVDGGNTWLADSSFTDFGNNTYRISFSNLGETVAVDIQAVPVPAAVWLFLSAMLGLTGVMRKRRI